MRLKSTEGKTVVCNKVTFSIRSQVGDTIEFSVTIDGKTQSFNYTSESSTVDAEYSFDIPVTFTNDGQEVEIVTTSLTNSDELKPRFRIYDITFHLENH